MSEPVNEKIRAELEIVGTESVDKAIAKEKELKQAVYELGQGYGANSLIVQAAMDKQVAAAVKATQAQKDQVQEQVRAQKIMNEIVSEATAGAKAAAASVGGGAGGNGNAQRMGMQQLAFALNDFVSTSGGFAQKLNGIANNLQMFALSLGMGGAWFVGITAAISALQVLSQNWEKLSAEFQGLPDPAKLKEAADKLQDMANKYKATVEGLEKQTPPGKEGSAQRSEEIIHNIFAGEANTRQIQRGAESMARGGAVSDMIHDQLDKLSSLQTERNAVDRNTGSQLDQLVGTWGNNPAVQQQIRQKGEQRKKDLDAQIKAIEDGVAQSTANRLIANAQKLGDEGKLARKQLIGLARQRPDLFPANFADRLKGVDETEERVARQSIEAYGTEMVAQELEDAYTPRANPPRISIQPTPGHQGSLADIVSFKPRAVEQARNSGALRRPFNGMNPADWRRQQQAINEKPVNPNDPLSSENVAPGLVQQQRQITEMMWKGMVSQAEALGALKEIQSRIDIMRREQNQLLRGFQGQRRTARNMGSW